MKENFYVSMIDRNSLKAFLGEERVNGLTDDDLQTVAEELNGRLVDSGYWEEELRELLEERDERAILEKS